MSANEEIPLGNRPNVSSTATPVPGRPSQIGHTSRALKLAADLWQMEFPQVEYLGLTFPIMVNYNDQLHPVVVSVAEEFEDLCRDLGFMFGIQGAISLRVLFERVGNDWRPHYLGPQNTRLMLRLLRTRAGVDTLMVGVL